MRAVGLLIFLVALAACAPSEPPFVTRCKRTLDLRLHSPSTATYGDIREVLPNQGGALLNSLDRHGHTAFGDFEIWLAYVDASNAFGTPRRSYIFCVSEAGEFNASLYDSVDSLSPLLGGLR